MRKFNLLGEETAKIQAGPRRGTLWARAMGGMGLNGGDVSSQARPSMVVGMRRRGREEVATQTDMSSLGGGKFQARQRTMSVRALDGVLGEEAEDPFDPDEIMDYGAFKNPLKNIGKSKKEGKLPKEKQPETDNHPSARSFSTFFRASRKRSFSGLVPMVTRR